MRFAAVGAVEPLAVRKNDLPHDGLESVEVEAFARKLCDSPAGLD